jgi:hypothetical protein
MEKRELGSSTDGYFLYNVLPVCFLDLFATAFECSLHFCTDFLPQLGGQFDIDVRLEERCTDLFQQ